MHVKNYLWILLNECIVHICYHMNNANTKIVFQNISREKQIHLNINVINNHNYTFYLRGKRCFYSFFVLDIYHNALFKNRLLDIKS